MLMTETRNNENQVCWPFDFEMDCDIQNTIFGLLIILSELLIKASLIRNKRNDNEKVTTTAAKLINLCCQDFFLPRYFICYACKFFLYSKLCALCMINLQSYLNGHAII